MSDDDLRELEQEERINLYYGDNWPAEAYNYEEEQMDNLDELDKLCEVWEIPYDKTRKLLPLWMDPRIVAEANKPVKLSRALNCARSRHARDDWSEKTIRRTNNE